MRLFLDFQMLLDQMTQIMTVNQVISQGLVALKKINHHFTAPFFHNVNFWEKVFWGCIASCETVITQFGHYKIWLQNLALLLGI